MEESQHATDRLTDLDASSCLELLRMLDVGRVAWMDAAGQIVIMPVNFAFDGADIIVRTASQSLCAAVTAGSRFSFQGDDVEASVRGGWAVLAAAAVEEVTDPAEVQRLRPLVSPWRDSRAPTVLRLRLSNVTGRRLLPQPGSVRTIYVDPDDLDAAGN